MSIGARLTCLLLCVATVHMHAGQSARQRPSCTLDSACDAHHMDWSFVSYVRTHVSLARELAPIGICLKMSHRYRYQHCSKHDLHTQSGSPLFVNTETRNSSSMENLFLLPVERLWYIRRKPGRSLIGIWRVDRGSLLTPLPCRLAASFSKAKERKCTGLNRCRRGGGIDS